MTFQPEAIVTEMDRLRKFARKLCRNVDDAEDLLQATVLKAIEKKHMFKEGTNLFSWSSKIMYNDFVSAYRRKVKFETQYDCEDIIANKAVAPKQRDVLRFARVNEAIKTMSPEHREVLEMVCIEGYKYKEVADKLDIPVGTVRSRLSRARTQLKDMMETASYNDNEIDAKGFEELRYAA